MAQDVGVQRTTVAMWESGKSRPRAELLPKLAKLFGCSIEELLVPGGPEKDSIRNAPQGAGRKGDVTVCREKKNCMFQRWNESGAGGPDLPGQAALYTERGG